MHMWMWFGYDLGDFMFPGLTVNSRWAFSITWIVLFLVSVLFEGSKVYLARVQRRALIKLFPYLSDERRNLLHDREHGSMSPTTSRNTSTVNMSTRTLVNLHQSSVFLAHSWIGYLLMLAVMLYNAYLLIAVVLGMMLGYFLFGTKLTLIQMQCLNTRRVVVCTPECDDTAENSNPPVLDSSTESDSFICQTRTCITPSHYFPANSQQHGDGQPSCSYGAKKCPSKVARVQKMQALAGPSRCHHSASEKEDSPSVEDVQLLRTERETCCKKKQEPHEKCYKKKESQDKCCKTLGNQLPTEEKEAEEEEVREDSPQISCCHATNPSDSQEQIVQ